MFLWGVKHWNVIARPLGFTGQAHRPDEGKAAEGEEQS